MSDVYLAFDTKKKKSVALKLIEGRDDRDTLDAIKAESDGVKLQRALSLADPAVPKVEDTGTLGDFFYIAMEYIEGTDLSEKIERRQLSTAEVVRIAASICRTLEIAHTLTTTIDGREITQIVHGDIKPKNIRLTRDGTVRLLDFGIAKALSLTRRVTHNDFGTLDYCSPERLDTGRLDAQSDLWSLGVMLYEMVSGSLPFQAETTRAQEALIMSGQPPPPLPTHCPKPLSDLIMKALDPDASRRHQSAAEMLDELSGLIQSPTRRIHREEKSNGHHVNETAVNDVHEAVSSAGSAGEHVQAETSQGRATATASGSERVTQTGGAAVADAGGRGNGGGQRFRLGPLLFKVAITVVVSMAVVMSAAEWLAWKAKRELYEDLSKLTFLHLTDSEEFWNRYKGVENKGVLKLGLPELRARMKTNLLNIAQRVIKDYEKEKPTAKETDWLDAKASLARALEIDSGDASVKAMMLYCDGQVERINGDAQKSRKKSQDASNRYNNAMRLFDDAAELQPKWADPHLGLAVVYAYGSANADRAVEELDKVKELGLNLGNREVVLRADCLRLKADDEYGDLQRTSSASVDDYKNTKQQYAQALDKYRQVVNVYDNSRKYVREIEDKMRKLDAAIERLEQPSGDGPAEVNQL